MVKLKTIIKTIKVHYYYSHLSDNSGHWKNKKTTLALHDSGHETLCHVLKAWGQVHLDADSAIYIGVPHHKSPSVTLIYIGTVTYENTIHSTILILKLNKGSVAGGY